MESDKLSMLDEENLILLVKEYNELYDPKHPNFNCSELKELCWKLIANRLGENVFVCKRTWGRLRYLARIYVLSKNEGNEDFPELQFKEQLSYLFPFLGAKYCTSYDSFPTLNEAHPVESNDDNENNNLTLEIEKLLLNLPVDKVKKLMKAYEEIILDQKESSLDQKESGVKLVASTSLNE